MWNYEICSFNWSLLYLAIIDCPIPSAHIAAIVEDPPDDINSNGTPVIGIKPDTPPTLISKCVKMYFYICIYMHIYVLIAVI